jgi:hypothetical protein
VSLTADQIKHGKAVVVSDDGLTIDQGEETQTAPL